MTHANPAGETDHRLEQIPDVLTPRLVRQHLHRGPFRRRIYHFYKTDSTNSVAMCLGKRGAPHGTLVFAEEQTAGRGRAGHTWHSEKTNGIYMSAVLRPAISPPQAPIVTLVAGLAVRDAIHEQTGVVPDLRWPNDLLFGRRKFCGILTEMDAGQDHVHFLVTGIGINVNHESVPSELSEIATSLRIETGRIHSRVEIVARLLRHLDSYYNRFLSDGAQAIIARFEEVSTFAHGKRVRVAAATETYSGTTAGLEPGGLLRVRRDDGRTLPVLSGVLTEAD
jgi:BirA family biotin operon repressor/biotin-[acetyl-CoA-carboxylase] ligase